jgi:long-subunit fatty acid transport protein
MFSIIPKLCRHLLYRRAILAAGVSVLFLVEPDTLYAAQFTIPTPAGPIGVQLQHAGPDGSLTPARMPQHGGFRPPVIFTAPLPSGSGARALGVAGAFTAVADDATAASWNPAGLIQLERPEASAVYRFSRTKNTHGNIDNAFKARSATYEEDNLNYFSTAHPFQSFGRNAVLALNYQEAYDFAQRFDATIHQQERDVVDETSASVFHETRIQRIVNPDLDLTITSEFTTTLDSRLHQVIVSDLLTALNFRQEGVIDAITPALAVEIHPHLSLGMAVNFYRDAQSLGHPLQSTTRAVYEGHTTSYAHTTDERTTTGTYAFEGRERLSGAGAPPIWIDLPYKKDNYPPFSETEESDTVQQYRVEGEYNEFNTFTDLQGVNATLGALWEVSSRLNLGCTVDLPWTAEAEQTKRLRSETTVYDASGLRLVDHTVVEERISKDVEFKFPLYCAVGALWRWTDRLYTSLDVSITQWSEFSFKAEGEERLNPLDGSAYGEHGIDDCWAVRGGAEYLWIMRRLVIPFRVGASWEQRPAIGTPDNYWGFSLGSGLSAGKDPGKLILDIAYLYLRGDEAMGSIVEGRDGLETDVEKHEVYVSGIWHF